MVSGVKYCAENELCNFPIASTPLHSFLSLLSDARNQCRMAWKIHPMVLRSMGPPVTLEDATATSNSLEIDECVAYWTSVSHVCVQIIREFPGAWSVQMQDGSNSQWLTCPEKDKTRFHHAGHVLTAFLDTPKAAIDFAFHLLGELHPGAEIYQAARWDLH